MAKAKKTEKAVKPEVHNVKEAETVRKLSIKRAAEVLSDINSEFGAGSIRAASDASSIPAVESIATALPFINNILNGGFPRGRLIELYGNEGSGKTSLALHVIACAQHRGGVAAFIDAEHALDISRAQDIGVNMDALMINQPSSGEQALAVCEKLIESNEFDVVVVDSVAALVPTAELEGDMSDATGGAGIAAQARMMSRCLRRLHPVIGKSRTCVIFINQTREKVGVIFGNPNTTPGGKALKFYADVRMQISASGKIEKDGAMIGKQASVKLLKSKVSPPFSKAEFDILFYAPGLSNKRQIIEFAGEVGIIKKGGAWYSLVDDEGKEHKVGHGSQKSVEWFDQHPEWSNWLIEKVTAKHKEQEEARRKAVVTDPTPWGMFVQPDQ